MSKTKNHIEQEEINLNPEIIDDSESNELAHIEELAEQHQMREDYRRMAELGHHHEEGF